MGDKRREDYINLGALYGAPRADTGGIPRSKPARGPVFVPHEESLQRDLEIINAHASKELGRLPPNGLSVERMIDTKSRPLPALLHHETREDGKMKLNHAAAAVMTVAMAACKPQTDVEAVEKAQAPLPSVEQAASVAPEMHAEPKAAVPERATTYAAPMAPDEARASVSSSDSYGSDYGIRATYEKCMKHQIDGTSTAGHRQNCADQEYEFQDARLNRVYESVISGLKARGGEGVAKSLQLRNEQRAWLFKIQGVCAEAAEKAGSAMGPAAQSTCFMEQTAMRADELEREYGSLDK